jgi:hypothetical protein
LVKNMMVEDERIVVCSVLMRTLGRGVAHCNIGGGF